MVQLKVWQWVVLATPIATIVGFLLISAGLQIHEWRINWIWGVFTVVFVGWRWLLVKWTRPAIAQIESVMAEVSAELESGTGDTVGLPGGKDAVNQA
ncbi:GTPase, partial [Coleofasciculus sp. FACHB-SPT36]|nr:GTPase [Coleofasciculus sp. FACHB-SPT36]